MPSTCRPYDEENIEGFIMDFEYGLAGIKKLDDLKFRSILSNKEQMLTVQCIVCDREIYIIQFIEEVCKRWVDKIQFENSFYKVEINYINKESAYKLIFATWHSMYLTGKITVSYK